MPDPGAESTDIVPVLDQSLLHTKPYILVSVVDIDAEVVDEVGKSLLIPDLNLEAGTDGQHRGMVSRPFVMDEIVLSEAADEEGFELTDQMAIAKYLKTRVS